jgi:isoquinoline 1-oxidoreductase beta subunit
VINPRGEMLSYGELAAEAAKLPLSGAPPLKDKSRFATRSASRWHALIRRRSATAARSAASTSSFQECSVPLITTARSFTGQVVEIRNEADILKMPGVCAVVKIPSLAIANEDAGSQHPHVAPSPRHNAVCVVADQFWQARRAIAALDVIFDRGTEGDLSTAKIDAMLEAALSAEHGVTALVRGEPKAVLQERAASIIERRFMLPHIAHAPLEPVNATASYHDGKVEVWGSIIRPARGGRARDRMRRRRREDQRHVSRRQLAAGSSRFVAGRSAERSGARSKLIRSREEDMQHDVYQPNAGQPLSCGPRRWAILAIHARVAGRSCSRRPARVA